MANRPPVDYNMAARYGLVPDRNGNSVPVNQAPPPLFVQPEEPVSQPASFEPTLDPFQEEEVVEETLSEDEVEGDPSDHEIKITITKKFRQAMWLGGAVVLTATATVTVMNLLKSEEDRIEQAVAEQLEEASSQRAQEEAPLGANSEWTNVDGSPVTGEPVPIEHPDGNLDTMTASLNADLSNRYGGVGTVQILTMPDAMTGNSGYAGFGGTTFEFNYVDGTLLENYYANTWGTETLVENYGLFLNAIENGGMARMQPVQTTLESEYDTLDPIELQGILNEPSDVIVVSTAPEVTEEDLYEFINLSVPYSGIFNTDFSIFVYNVTPEMLDADPSWSDFVPNYTDHLAEIWPNIQPTEWGVGPNANSLYKVN